MTACGNLGYKCLGSTTLKIVPGICGFTVTREFLDIKYFVSIHLDREWAHKTPNKSIHFEYIWHETLTVDDVELKSTTVRNTIKEYVAFRHTKTSNVNIFKIWPLKYNSKCTIVQRRKTMSNMEWPWFLLTVY